jgi:hypothetical protein
MIFLADKKKTYFRLKVIAILGVIPTLRSYVSNLLIDHRDIA